MQEQLAYPSCKEGRRTTAGLRERRGLVSGGGQACPESEARRCGHHPSRGEALARRQEGQLVQPSGR